MNRQMRNIGLGFVVLVVAGTAPAQVPSSPATETAVAQNRSSDSNAFGKSYETLRPAQRRLIDDYVRTYNETTGSQIIAAAAYDAARLSIRTTFDAVTHALLNAPMTDAHGKSLGHAIDLVANIDDVMGEEPGMGGDRQFRLYVYLQPNAFAALNNSVGFKRDRDNTMYHKGFPICFRLRNGAPSIQFSISRDLRMADIDVDYRSSKLPQALFNGHLRTQIQTYARVTTSIVMTGAGRGCKVGGATCLAFHLAMKTVRHQKLQRSAAQALCR
jgi:hypothetical protein